MKFDNFLHREYKVKRKDAEDEASRNINIEKSDGEKAIKEKRQRQGKTQKRMFFFNTS